jgi:hypothetical protein
MSTRYAPWTGPVEELLAEVSDAAYRVLLRHGLKGSFLETELEVWQAVRGAFVARANDFSPATHDGFSTGHGRNGLLPEPLEVA